MHKRTVMCTVLIAAILVTVSAECDFPPDHPSFSINQNANDIRRAFDTYFYVYTDRFENCSGCVTELHLCYVDAHEPVLTVAIINDSNTIIHTHNINITGNTDSENYQISCSPNGVQGHYGVFCCVTQTLEAAEQFEVQSNFYYGLRTHFGNSSLAQFEESTSGYYDWVNHFGEEIAVGYTIPSITSTLWKSFFYFSITPGNCPSVHPSPAPSQITMATSTGSPTTTNTSSVSTTVTFTTSMVTGPSTTASNSASTTATSAISVVTGPSTTATYVSSVPAMSASSVLMSAATDTHNAAGNDSTAVVIGVTISTVLLILVVTLVLLGVAVKILVKVKKKTHSMKIRQTIEGPSSQPSVYMYVNHTTSHNRENSTSSISNVLYDTIPASYNEAYGVSEYRHEPQTERDNNDRCVVNQLESDTLTHMLGTDRHISEGTSTTQTTSTEPIPIPTNSNAAYGLHRAPTVHNDEEYEVMQSDQEMQDPVADDSDGYVTHFNYEEDPLYTTVP